MKSFEILILGLALTILERFEHMEKKLTDAIADLNTEVEDESTKLASIATYVRGVPGIVAAAVAEALANVGVEEAAAADQIEAARDKAAASVSDTLSAVEANTPSSDTGGSSTGTGSTDTSATDLSGGGEQTQPGSGSVDTAAGQPSTVDNPPPSDTSAADDTSGDQSSGTGDGSTDGSLGGDTSGTDTSGGSDVAPDEQPI